MMRPAEEFLSRLRTLFWRIGVPVDRIMRELLGKAQSLEANRLLMQHAGLIRGGPRDVSFRKGFSRE